MNKEFIKWLRRKRYKYLKINPDDGSHIWMIYKRGLWKWKQIKDYEY